VNQLHAIRVFLRVAENNSLSRAAASLDLSNAAVTRSLSLLESHLNTRLVNRTTRSLSLTEAGEVYALGCRKVVELLDSIDSAIGSGNAEANGTLRLVVAPSFALLGLPPLLRRYCQLNPDVKVDLKLLHRNVDVVEDSFDAGIVASWQVNAGTLIRRPLTVIRPVVVASPDYLAAHGKPATPDQLATHCILAPSREIHSGSWRFADAQGEHRIVDLTPRFTVNDMIMLRQLVLFNMGVAILPGAYVKEDIRNRTLIPLLTDHAIQESAKELSLVYPGRHYIPARTRSFIDLTLEHFHGTAVDPSMANRASATRDSRWNQHV
jgi:DNA-binding transcriptional LysR family regulator